MAMQLRSPVLSDQATIERKYTCEGGDVSPPLSWSGVPRDARSFTLMVDDPDAPSGDFLHWMVFDLPATTTELPEGGPLPKGAHTGRNDFGKTGYGGPCPPPGKPHRYFFRLYALDNTLDLPNNASREDVEHAMEGHILDKAELFGTFGR